MIILPIHVVQIEKISTFVKLAFSPDACFTKIMSNHSMRYQKLRQIHISGSFSENCKLKKGLAYSKIIYRLSFLLIWTLGIYNLWKLKVLQETTPSSMAGSRFKYNI